jgi:RHS repeat-associated protein
MIELRTGRHAGVDGLATQIFIDAVKIQDLHYTYDPIGNITRITDAALRVVYHNNQKVEPVCGYTYDPLYRLVKATGRENIAQSFFDLAPEAGDYRDYPFVGAAQICDLHALRNYAEHYEYDPLGNILRINHSAEHGNWTRQYAYREDSLIEPEAKSNRLSRTHLQTHGNLALETYLYDAHGNTIQMPHLPSMQWDFLDQLHMSSRQVANTGAAEASYYAYDATGRRVRKITETRQGSRKNERLYLGGFEVYREYEVSGEKIALERETLHVVDDTRRIALVETLTIDRGRALAELRQLRRFQFANHLGSACLELDESGRLISYEEYAPYGGTTYQTGRSASEVKLKRYRYTGTERDEENGFSYHGARYCAPWLARWTATDPGGLAGTLNLYLYVSANPIIAVDTTGYNDNNVVDQSGEYGGTSSPGGAPPAAQPAPPPSSEGEPSPAPDSKTVYPADFIGPLPEGATRATSPAHDAAPDTPPAPDTTPETEPEPNYLTQDQYRALDLGTAFLSGGTTGVLDYLHAEANTRPDAGVEETELPPGGTDWSAGGEGGLLSDPAMRQVTGAAVDTMVFAALDEALAGGEALGGEGESIVGGGDASSRGPALSGDPAAVKSSATLNKGQRRSQINVGDAYAYGPATDGEVVANLAEKLEAGLR